MSLNGIWKLEIFGPYGWEPMATAFLNNGIYEAGGRNHYEAGKYQVSGNHVKASFKYITHGEARTMFGKKMEEMNLKFEGDIDGNMVQGYFMEEEGNHQVVLRATRLADLLR